MPEHGVGAGVGLLVKSESVPKIVARPTPGVLLSIPTFVHADSMAVWTLAGV
jgi:hypothetical protein